MDANQIDSVFELIGNGASPTVQPTVIAGLTITGGSQGGDGGGGVDSEDAITLREVTVDDNEDTGSFGGGIQSDGGTMRIENSIISNNSSTGNNGGGGIHIDFGELIVENSTIANNNPDATDSDFVNTNPRLAALANNGGPTNTLALKSGSLTIDTVEGCPPPTSAA